jgi:Holliday junction resolvase RusA-like endonuclease
MSFFEITLHEQPVGVGKNNYIVIKSGFHIPRKSFNVWKMKAKKEIIESGKRWTTWTDYCKMTLLYKPKDRYKRDATAIIDGVFNLLEELRIIEDDNQVKRIHYEELLNDVDFCLYIKLEALSK